MDNQTDIAADTEHGIEERARFTAMEHGTKEDWSIIGRDYFKFAEGLPDRVLTHLNLLKGDFGGFPVCRLEHSLQCATRAMRDGRDERYVTMALLHDIGDTLGTYNHPDVGAAIIKPFVDERTHWICQHHGAFQGYYYFHYLGMDQNAREAFRGHEHFAACEEFCAKYDQSAFDPDYAQGAFRFWAGVCSARRLQPADDERADCRSW